MSTCRLRLESVALVVLVSSGAVAVACRPRDVVIPVAETRSDASVATAIAPRRDAAEVDASTEDDAAIAPGEKPKRLEPSDIQRVVRGSMPVFRRCYEDGLRASPSLVGRVVVTFVIAPDGSVTSSRDAHSDYPDRAVVGCVVAATRGLRFPASSGKSLTVTYPLVFSPGE